MLNRILPPAEAVASAHPGLYYLIGSMLLLLPALSVLVDHGASGPYLVLWLTALILLPKTMRTVRLDASERILLWILAFYFIAVTLSWLLTGQNEPGVAFVKRAARFLVVIPLYLLLRWLRPDIRWLAYGFMAGAIGAGIWAIDHFVGVYGSGFVPRANGATHPILFGNLALIMGVMSLAMWRLEASWIWKLLTLLALGLGLAASLFSGTRGGWIALPALSVLLIWCLFRSLGPARKLSLLALLVAIGVGLYLIPGTGIQERVMHGQVDIQRYMAGDTIANSLGERFNMWEASWILFRENPLFGVGIGNFIDEAQALMHKGVVGEFNVLHYHAHNIYFTALAQIGLVGIGITLAVLLYPLMVFWRALGAEDRAVSSAALSGVCLVIAYIHFGLTEAVFTRSLSTIFYALCVAVLFSVIVDRSATCNDPRMPVKSSAPSE